MKSEPTSIEINGRLISDKNEIAAQFNKYFSNIAENIDQKIVKCEKSYKDYLNDLPNPKSYFLSPVTPSNIKDYISTLKNHKSSGPNSIPTFFLKTFKDVLCYPLSEMFSILRSDVYQRYSYKTTFL